MMMMYAYGWAGARVWRGPLDLSILRALRREERPRAVREAPPAKMLSDRGADGESEAAEERARCGNAITRLPDDERDVLIQRLFEGLSCAAIAAQSGRSEAEVRRTQLRALERLQTIVPSTDE